MGGVALEAALRDDDDEAQGGGAATRAACRLGDSGGALLLQTVRVRKGGVHVKVIRIAGA